MLPVRDGVKRQPKLLPSFSFETASESTTQPTLVARYQTPGAAPERRGEGIAHTHAYTLGGRTGSEQVGLMRRRCNSRMFLDGNNFDQAVVSPVSVADEPAAFRCR